jgi:hypothetical protein
MVSAGSDTRKIGTHAEEGHVEDHKVQSHAEGDRRNQIRIAPKRHDKERLVFTQRVACIEHLDDCHGELEGWKRNEV